MIEIYSKQEFAKRSKWSAPKRLSQLINFHGSLQWQENGKTVTAAIEDVITSVQNANDLSNIVHQSIDILDDEIEQLKEQLENKEPNPQNDMITETDHQEYDPHFTNECSSNYPSVGDNISVYWPLDNMFYDCVIHSQIPDVNITVHYNDGDVESLDPAEQTRKYTVSESFAHSCTLQIPSQQKGCTERFVQTFCK